MAGLFTRLRRPGSPRSVFGPADAEQPEPDYAISAEHLTESELQIVQDYLQNYTEARIEIQQLSRGNRVKA